MIRKTTKKLRLLDFDIENRPLSYWYDGNCTAEVTAIAWSWDDEEGVFDLLLTKEGDWIDEIGARFSYEEGLRHFWDVFQSADIVTGHYIRRHDLPILNGAMMEYSLPPLPPKMTSDTRLDLIRKDGIPASQEHLAEMLGVDAPKQKMSQSDWREANRLTEEGFEKTRERVVADVIQHKQLRNRLIELGYLGKPSIWRP